VDSVDDKHHPLPSAGVNSVNLQSFVGQFFSKVQKFCCCTAEEEKRIFEI